MNLDSEKLLESSKIYEITSVPIKFKNSQTLINQSGFILRHEAEKLDKSDLNAYAIYLTEKVCCAQYDLSEIGQQIVYFQYKEDLGIIYIILFDLVHF